MLTANFQTGAVNSILCLGAHSDDIEIGAAGSILRLIGMYPGASIHWVVLTTEGDREKEARASADALLTDTERKEIFTEKFRNGFFPYEGAKIKEFFESLKRKVDPDIVLTHYREDLHQDHRCVSDLTWNTFRNHLILEYEIPKYDGDIGSPNFFIPLSDELVEKKLVHLESHFQSQHTKPWFSRDTFSAIMRLRGMECNASSGYAEGFYARKLAL